jgi:hypothetical protein
LYSIDAFQRWPEIIDRSIVRKLDDSGFIDRTFAAAGAK